MVVIHAVRLSALGMCVLAACVGGRTPLSRLAATDGAAEVARPAPDARDVATDRRPEVAPDLPLDLVPDIAFDLPPEARPELSTETRPEVPFDLWIRGFDVTPAAPEAAPEVRPEADAPAHVTPGCTPVPETCNGVDDDCDGVVDNDIAPIPCPSGGFRYCVGGQTSACPTRCEVCVPGGKRICFISYCTYWGTQTCASDGRSWSYCVEQKPVPKTCASVAADQKRSPLTEQCCIDNGFCCLDEFDLNGNGDKSEMLGRCQDVLCDSPQ